MFEREYFIDKPDYDKYFRALYTPLEKMTSINKFNITSSCCPPQAHNFDKISNDILEFMFRVNEKMGYSLVFEEDVRLGPVINIRSVKL